MKKEKLLFTFSVLLLFSVSPAYSQKWLWGVETKPYTHNAGGEILMDHTIVADTKGNVYTQGMFAGTMIFGNDTLTAYAIDGDICLIKYAPNGNQLWVRQVKPSKTGLVTGKATTADDSDNVYITGMFSDSLKFGPTTLVSANGSYDTYIAKYYANGNLAWAKQFNLLNMYSFSYGYGIVTDHAGNIYTAGLLGDTVAYESDTIKLNNSSNIYIAKLNSAGHLQWMKISNSYGVVSYCSMGSLAIDPAGNPFVAGTYKDSVAFGRDTLITKSYNGELFVAKYDPAGNVLWASSTVSKNTACQVLPYSVSVDGNGDAYVDGYFYDTVSFGPDRLIETRLSQNSFVTRFSGKTGKIQWGLATQSTLNTIWQSFSISSDTLKRGGCYILMEGGGTGGSYNFNFGSDTFKFSTPYTTVQAIVQFDSAGHAICGGETSEGNEDDGDGIAVAPSGKFVYLGADLFNTTVFGPDTLLYGGDMPFVACLQTCDTSSNTAAVTELKDINGKVNVYPNPSNGKFTIALSHAELVSASQTIVIYNMLGQPVLTETLRSAQGDNSINLTNQPNGIYLYRVISETGELLGEGKLVIEK